MTVVARRAGLTTRAFLRLWSFVWNVWGGPALEALAVDASGNDVDGSLWQHAAEWADRWLLPAAAAPPTVPSSPAPWRRGGTLDLRDNRCGPPPAVLAAEWADARCGPLTVHTGRSGAPFL